MKRIRAIKEHMGRKLCISQRLWYITAAAEFRQSPTFSGAVLARRHGPARRPVYCHSRDPERGREGVVAQVGGAPDINHESQVIDRLKFHATIFRHSLSQLLLLVLGELQLYFHA